MKKNQSAAEVVPIEKGWAIKSEGNTRKTVLNRFKKEAIVKGR